MPEPGDPMPDPHISEYLRRSDAQDYLKVLEVLRKWDPIGVIDGPNGPQDEYDTYAPDLIRMLDARKSREEIVRHLGVIASDHMGLENYDREHTAACVRELIDFWREWKGI